MLLYFSINIKFAYQEKYPVPFLKKRAFPRLKEVQKYTEEVPLTVALLNGFSN